MDETVDGMVSPRWIEAVEVGRGPSTAPSGLLGEYARCGVVVIRTRRGG